MLAFYDVDTQKDFILINGKLYVPGAIEIIPNITLLTAHAYENNILILGSVDRHFEDDKELEIFLQHCMDKTSGQQKIECSLLPNHLITYVPSKVGMFGKYDELSNNEIQIYEKNFKQIIFEKQSTDVFTNRNIMKFLDRLRVSEVVVYGVATEYCVKDAVLGFLKLGIKVYVVSDAIKGINKNDVDNAVKLMKDKGAIFVTTNKIIQDVNK